MEASERAREILFDLLWCDRVWSAWDVGTMSESDFRKADECEDIVDTTTELIQAAERVATDRALEDAAKACDERSKASQSFAEAAASSGLVVNAIGDGLKSREAKACADAVRALMAKP